MSDVITLIGRTWTVDSIGQRKPAETQSNVFCELGSISRAEWSAAASNGHNPSIRVSLSAFDYADEAVCIWRGERYAVYRSFRDFEKDRVELYLEKQVGVSNVNDN